MLPLAQAFEGQMQFQRWLAGLGCEGHGILLHTSQSGEWINAHFAAEVAYIALFFEVQFLREWSAVVKQARAVVSREKEAWAGVTAWGGLRWVSGQENHAVFLVLPREDMRRFWQNEFVPWGHERLLSHTPEPEKGYTLKPGVILAFGMSEGEANSLSRETCRPPGWIFEMITAQGKFGDHMSLQTFSFLTRHGYMKK